MAKRRGTETGGPAAYLIVGGDTSLRVARRQEIVSQLLPVGAREFGVEKISLDRGSLPTVLARAATRPLLSPRQVLVLDNLDALGEEDVPALEKYFQRPAEFTILVFEAAKLDQRTRLAHLLLDKCRVFEADALDNQEAVHAVEELARAKKLKMARETAEELVYVLGSDLGRLRSEVEKLLAYVGTGHEVTSADVVAVVSAARRLSAFELADALGERRTAEALVLLRRLVESGEQPVGLVGVLAWLYRQLLQARTLPGNAPVWRAAQVLQAPRSRVQDLLRQGRRFSHQDLAEGLSALLQADVALKSSPPDPGGLLEMLVVRLGRRVEDRVGDRT